MNITVKNVNSYKKLLKIEVPAAEVTKAYDDVYREYGNTASIKGFRKGKIPIDVIKTYFKSDAEGEVLKRIIPTAYSKAVEEKELRPVQPPTIGKVDFKPDMPLCFEAEVEVRPEIKLPNYKEISVEIKKVEVKDDDVESAVKNLQERNAQFEPVNDRGIKMGDFALLDHELIVEGKTIDSGKDLLWPVEDKGYFPGLGKGLLNAKQGDKKEIDTSIPAEYKDEAYRNKKAVLKAEIKEIKIKKIPELNDEFVKELGADVKNIDELRAKIKEEISRYNEDIKKMDKENKVCDYLIKKTSFEVSPTLVEKQLDFIVDDARQRHKQQTAAEKFDEPKARESHREKAVNQIKLYFILEVIAEAEDVKVDEKDVDEKIKGMAARMGKNYMETKKHFLQEGKYDSLKDKIREEKVIALLVDKAKVKEK
ncbi:trigger factor [Candidatus Auribacterota bacterium]